MSISLIIKKITLTFFFLFSFILLNGQECIKEVNGTLVVEKNYFKDKLRGDVGITDDMAFNCYFFDDAKTAYLDVYKIVTSKDFLDIETLKQKNSIIFYPIDYIGRAYLEENASYFKGIEHKTDFIWQKIQNLDEKVGKKFTGMKYYFFKIKCKVVNGSCLKKEFGYCYLYQSKKGLGFDCPDYYTYNFKKFNLLFVVSLPDKSQSEQ